MTASEVSGGISIMQGGQRLAYRELDKPVFIQLAGLPLMQALVYHIRGLFIFHASGQALDGEERVLSIKSIVG